MVLRNELNNIFRTDLQKKKKLSYAKEQLDILTDQYQSNITLHRKAWRTEVTISLPEYFDAMKIYNKLNQTDAYKLRIDPLYTMTIFSNDKEFLLDIANSLNTKSIEFWEPAQEYISILKNNTQIIIVDSPPELQLKVWFNNVRVQNDFGDWIIANSDKCKIGYKALQNVKSHGFLNGLYMYIRDEKVLNLVTLLAGSSIGRIEKLVYKDDIDK